MRLWSGKPISYSCTTACAVVIGVWLISTWKVQLESIPHARTLSTDVPAEAVLVDRYCRGCRHTIVEGDERRCGSYMQDNATTRSLPQVCRDTCWEDTCDKRVFRYDSVIPTTAITSSSSEPSFWLSHSVPQHHRLPVTAVSNITHFLLDDDRVFPNAEYYFEYNPSIVPLAKTHQLRLLSNENHYLASFRVSNQHSCMQPEDRKRMAGIFQGAKQTAKSHLGLAILNAQFKVVSEATVDLKAVGFTGAQDFRLFHLRGKTYITSNDLIAELILTNEETAPMPGGVLVPNVFTDDTSMKVWVHRNPACAPCGKNRGFCGKNFNYFTTDEEVLTEIWPSGPHTVRPVILDQPCQRSTPARSYVDSPKGNMPSFSTTEEVDFPLLAPHQNIFTNRGRGSACCVPIVHRGQELLLGIQHRKTPSQRNAQLPEGLINNHYVSSFYAFENKPPFRQIAESGHFCLGFGNAELTKANAFRQLKIGRTFNCPRIHFVSGMIQDGKDSLIISYGINDCVSRFVRVRLDDVRQVLFSGPSS